MANQFFRSAFRGFHRQDVVQYIEYLNQQHASQIAQLTGQLQAARENGDCEELRRQLDALTAHCAELEAALAEKETAPAPDNDELEAYRRAERTERLARERAGQIYTQANAVLADATVKAETASSDLSAITQQIQNQFATYQASLQSTRETLQDAVAVLYSIRPEE